MIKPVAALLSVALVAGCAGGDGDAEDESAPQWSVECPDVAGDVAAEDFADMTLPCLVGDDDYDVGAVDGRPVLITLWASWCVPCRDEAPQVQRFHEEMGDEVVVIGVATQDDEDKARYFAEDFGFTFPSVFDERGQVLHSQSLTALPATFLVDADGRTVETFAETGLTYDDLAAAASEHFGVTP
ncbi:MAG: TlpA family protein disulfide reductase [Stackebrandtia sp.]